MLKTLTSVIEGASYPRACSTFQEISTYWAWAWAQAIWGVKEYNWSGLAIDRKHLRSRERFYSMVRREVKFFCIRIFRKCCISAETCRWSLVTKVSFGNGYRMGSAVEVFAQWNVTLFSIIMHINYEMASGNHNAEDPHVTQRLKSSEKALRVYCSLYQSLADVMPQFTRRPRLIILFLYSNKKFIKEYRFQALFAFTDWGSIEDIFCMYPSGFDILIFTYSVVIITRLVTRVAVLVFVGKSEQRW